MKRFRTVALALTLAAAPTTASAYIGVGVGAVDEDHFGFALGFGGGLPWNLGIDAQLVSYIDTNIDGTNVDNYWLQANVDVLYDFNHLWKRVTEKIELHPFVKMGFTYGAAFINAGVTNDTEASHGPGMNFGGGIDWKLFSFLTVGIDLYESIIWMDGISVGGVDFPDTTAKVFNALAWVKFFAY